MIKRQGDILFTKVDSAPKQQNIVVKNIVAYGEATGHCHKLEGGILYLDEKNEMFVISEGGAHVLHEEHNRINLEEGVWKVTRQAEYQPSGWREVVD